MDRTVIKSNGQNVPWDRQRIIRAVTKALESVGALSALAEVVYANVDAELSRGIISVDLIHDVVERQLMQVAPAAAKSYILYRDRRRQGAKIVPVSGEIQRYIHPAKYGRWLPDKKRRETFEETVTRTFDMHRSRFPDHHERLARIEQSVLEKRLLPSMRCMQFGGDAILAHNARMYNCSFTHIDRRDVFGKALYLLLCGCGVGFSVQKLHVNRLPALVEQKRAVTHFTVPDTIEGWGDAVTALVNEAMTTGSFVEFNYSLIRPEGTPLKTSGGKAPGHLPLKHCLENVRSVLTGAAGRKLRPLECHDIMCFLAEAVLAGGIRRSSLISLFDPTDTEMMECKTPGKMQPQRKMANNSAVHIRGRMNLMEIEKIVTTAIENWDPGLYLCDDLDEGTNPCAEIGLYPLLVRTPENKDKVAATLRYQEELDRWWGDCVCSTFAFCNLTETNGATSSYVSPVGDGMIFLSELQRRSFLAAELGTFQACYDDFPYLGIAATLVNRRDALLGVSITGMADNPRVCFNPDLLRAAGTATKQANRALAPLVGLPPARRITCVKPSGTASLELDVASGIHPHHAKRYIRRVKANPLEPVAQWFRAYNPHAIEIDDNGDWLLMFPCKAPEGAATLDNTDAMTFLEQVKNVYKNWVEPQSYDGPSHNVSCTVAIHEHEIDNMIQWVFHNQNDIRALSFSTRFNEKNIRHLPRQKIDGELDEALWKHLIDNWTPVDYTKMVESDDNTSYLMDPACAGGKCEI